MSASAPLVPDADLDAPLPGSPALRLVGLALATAAVTALIYRLGGVPWIVVIYSVIAIIMLHEFGHYLTARWSGMKATEFFVGFGPKLWSIRRGETEYGIKALPLGGYVRILGMTSLEELSDDDEPRSFINQPVRRRVLVASAGSIVHVLLAVILGFCALFFIGEPTNNVQIDSLVKLVGVTTPAQAAGLRPGDDILAVDGTKATLANVSDLIQKSKGTTLRLLVARGAGATRHTWVVTVRPRALSKGGAPEIGVFLAGVLRHPGFLDAWSSAGSFTWLVTKDTGAAFGHAFSPHGLWTLYHDVTNSKAGAKAAANPNQPRSILGALSLLADGAKAGMLPFLEILISLNISLAVLNMFPMLPLDGGHVAIALYERVRTRRGRAPYRADVTKLMPWAYGFLGLLLIFVISKAYLDVAHGVANPFG